MANVNIKIYKWPLWCGKQIEASLCKSIFNNYSYTIPKIMTYKIMTFRTRKYVNMTWFTHNEWWELQQQWKNIKQHRHWNNIIIKKIQRQKFNSTDSPQFWRVKWKKNGGKTILPSNLVETVRIKSTGLLLFNEEFQSEMISVANLMDHVTRHLW